MDNELFHQMKPRLQKVILDSVFSPFYKTFETIFEGCEISFQREIFMHSEYTFFHNESSNNDDEDAHGDKQDDEQADELFEK